MVIFATSSPWVPNIATIFGREKHPASILSAPRPIVFAHCGFASSAAIVSTVLCLWPPKPFSRATSEAVVAWRARSDCAVVSAVALSSSRLVGSTSTS